MSADKSYPPNLAFIVNGEYQSILIASDIEHYPSFFRDTGSSQFSFNFLRRAIGFTMCRYHSVRGEMASAKIGLLSQNSRNVRRAMIRVGQISLIKNS